MRTGRLAWFVDLSTLANVATALTVLTGVAFGLVEMRRARRDREERAAFAAVQALMTPEWMSSSMIVASIPDGTTAAHFESDPRILEASLKIATIMEGIGYSGFARIVPLAVADDLVGGMARLAWKSFVPSWRTSASGPVPRKAGNGSNGWRNNWISMAPAKPISGAALTRRIVIGGREEVLRMNSSELPHLPATLAIGANIWLHR